MDSREEGRRRTKTATIGLAAASLVGTVTIAVTVAAQSSAAEPVEDDQTQVDVPDINRSPTTQNPWSPPQAPLNNNPGGDTHGRAGGS